MPKLRRLLRIECAALALLLLAGLSSLTWGAKAPFVLSSADADLASMPEIYTAKLFGCSGGNASPPLRWSGAPQGAKSFVLTLFDRDEHSTPSGWWHWVVYDIPASVSVLAAGAGAEHSKLLPPAALQGRTDLGENAYHGPCPAKGDAPHRYVFTLYALDVAKLDVPAGASGAMVTSTAQEHLLAKAVLTIHHGRK